jgi:CheY-like chemotaxis protein
MDASENALKILLQDDESDTSFVSSCIIKTNDSNYSQYLIRNLCKWNFIKYVPTVTNSDDKNYLKGKKIIVADDQEVNLMVLSRILTNNGMIVEKAKDGNELYNKYIEGEFDLIISDIDMPDLDGLEAVKKIREYESKNSLKRVAALSCGGDSEKDKIHHFLKSGMDDYFIKGDDVSYLLSLVRLWINTTS